MAKYDLTRKANRNRLLVEHHQNHPELSYKELGELFGITKQRIHSIIKRDNSKKK